MKKKVLLLTVVVFWALASFSQSYEGTIIAKKNSSINTTITVRKVLQGIGVERVFLIHSPKVDSITVLRSAKVRRAKLYYLRNLEGKASRLKQTFKSK